MVMTACRATISSAVQAVQRPIPLALIVSTRLFIRRILSRLETAEGREANSGRLHDREDGLPQIEVQPDRQDAGAALKANCR
jgi:hypothetical protein